MAEYFTADWHWGDERMELLGRPYKNAKDAQEQTLAPLLALKPEDILYVNGDAAIDEEWLKPIQEIKCSKMLIRGNYDRLDDATYSKYFDFVGHSLDTTLVDPSGKFKELPVHICHYPGQSVPDRFNLTAHIHGCWRVQKNMLNVGIDVHYMLPLTLERLFFFFGGICNFYDQDVWVANHPANAAFDWSDNNRGKLSTYWQSGFGGTRDAK